MSPQGKYWLLTIPQESGWNPILPQEIAYIRGQLERGSNTSYLHYQVVVVTKKPVRLTKLKSLFNNINIHAELTRSDAAMAYVWKEDTRVSGTQFEFGTLPRNTKFTNEDWDDFKELALQGKFNEIPSCIYIRYLTNFHKLYANNLSGKLTYEPLRVNVYWGATGTGKTRKAFEEAGPQVFWKISTTKWWDGYLKQSNVLIDEFSGDIGITHLLRWLDGYPCSLEVKGTQVASFIKEVWITSNKDPAEWYNDTNSTLEQRLALRRRFTNVIYFPPSIFF